MLASLHDKTMEASKERQEFHELPQQMELALSFEETLSLSPKNGQLDVDQLSQDSGSDSNSKSKQDPVIKEDLYKTELCKKWMTSGSCRYAGKCRFAHGTDDLRVVVRHPLYKTSHCKSFQATGTCRYGSRCRFIHDETEDYLSRVPRGVAALNMSGDSDGGMFPRVPSAPANLSSYNHQHPGSITGRAQFQQQFGLDGHYGNSQNGSTQIPNSIHGHSVLGTSRLSAQDLVNQLHQHANGHHNQQHLSPHGQHLASQHSQHPMMHSHLNKVASSGQFHHNRLTSASAVNLSSMNQPGKGFPPTYKDFQTERQEKVLYGRPQGSTSTSPLDHNLNGLEDGMSSMFIGFGPQTDARQIPVASHSSSFQAGTGSPPSPPLSPPPMSSRRMHSNSDAELKASASAVAFSTLASPESIKPISPSQEPELFGRSLPSYEDMSSLTLPPSQFSSSSMNRSASQPVLNYQTVLGFQEDHQNDAGFQQIRHQSQQGSTVTPQRYGQPPRSLGQETGRMTRTDPLEDYRSSNLPPNRNMSHQVFGQQPFQNSFNSDSIRKAASVNELSSSRFFNGFYEQQAHGSNGNFGFFLHSTQEEGEDHDGSEDGIFY